MTKNQEALKKLIKENIRQISFFKETHKEMSHMMNCTKISCGNCVIYKTKQIYKENIRCWRVFNKILKVFNKFPEEDILEMLVGDYL